MINTFIAGFSRAAFNYDSYPFTNFPANLSFVSGGGPGGIVVGGGTTTTGLAAITSAGPNNAANVWNRRNLFTYSDGLQVTHGRHQIGAGVWFQRLRDNENTASRRVGQASFTTLTTFLQGTVSSFQVVPNPSALGWRSWYGAWYVQDAIQLHRNLTLQIGLRHEFSNGWNEVSGRAANYVTGDDGVLQTNVTLGPNTFTKNNAACCPPRASLAWDPFGKGKTSIRAGFGTHFTMIDALSFLLNSLPPYNGSIAFSNASLFSFTPLIPGAPVPPSCGPGGARRHAPPTRLRAFGGREDADCTGMECLHRATARAQFSAPRGLYGELRNTRSAERRPEHGARTDLRLCRGLHQRWCGRRARFRGAGCGICTGAPTRPNPYLGAGFFWFTEGNSSYNPLQMDWRTACGRTSVARELHLV